MSQDSEWAGVWMFMGAFFAVWGGIFQNWWVGRCQIKDDILEHIERSFVQIEAGWNAESVFSSSIGSIHLPLKRFERSVWCCKRKKLQATWNNYKNLEKHELSVEKIKFHINKLRREIESWC